MSLKIRQERIQRGWTQGFAARQIGMTKAAYRNIETGQRKPSGVVSKKLTAYSQGFHNKTKRIRRNSKWHVNMTMNTKYRQ